MAHLEPFSIQATAQLRDAPETVSFATQQQFAPSVLLATSCVLIPTVTKPVRSDMFLTPFLGHAIVALTTV